MSALGVLLRKARRRLSVHSILHRAAVVLVAGLAAGSLVLAAGTDTVAWYWPIAAMCVAACVIAMRGARRRPDDYTLARMLDRRLRLYDALSTALWFQTHDTVAWSEATVQRQREFANGIAAHADLRRAIPFKPSRSLWWAGGLALVVAALFVARYGTLARLDLAPPLFPGAVTQLAAVIFGQSHTEDAKAMDRARTRNAALAAGLPGIADHGRSSGKSAGAGRSADSASGNGIETAETRQVQSTVEADGSGSPDGAQREAAGGAQGDSESGADPSGAGAGDAKSQQQGGAQNGSLMDRVRDAMAGLMAKLGMQPNSAKPAAEGPRKNSGSGRSAQGPTASSHDENAQGGAPDAQNASGMSAQRGGGSEQSAAKGADAHANRPGQDANSGIGSEDGNKDTKMAAQLAAMGKLSEILGKRSQTLTGEVMVETTSSGQQLATPFSGRRSAHTDAGGEISRDQIPREYQQYVMQYFEQVHKLAAKRAAQP